MNTVQLFKSEEEAAQAAARYIASGTDVPISQRWGSIKEYLTAKGHVGPINIKAGKKTTLVAATNGTGEVPQRVYIPMSNGKDKLWINEKYLNWEDGKPTGLADSTSGVATFVKPRPTKDAEGNPTGEWHLSFEDYLSGSSANIIEVGTLTL